LAVAALLLVAAPAPAYVGPGTDVTFIGTALTLLLWMLAAFSAVLLWPFYALLRVLRRRKNGPATPSALEAAPEEARAVGPTNS
jgi:hypothetical protein